ncbi:MAG: pilus assembly protein TadG-related protein [Candidatus Dormibacteraeota bacterium]|nr:pilus assembly protein TadG-related protein [Candidatus Dormibacteraeota bacterium]
MTRAQILSPRSQAGQAIVLIAFMIIVLFGAVGLAVDGGIGYYYNNQAERAAAAAALSGVIFMPGQFTSAQAVPSGSRNDATDRAKDEARRNGFDWNDVANGVSVTTAAVAGFDNKLSVTVSRNAPVFFMQIFGITTYRVSRTAIATYLPPLSLGQPGTQVGSTTAQLGSGGNNFFFMRTEGYSTPRSQGDAFTTDPAGSGDVHAISRAQGSDPIGATLPDRGGYNYLVNLPNGGYINVYNAMFGPDNCTSNATDVNGAFVCPNGGGALPASEAWAGAGPIFHNHCDNHINVTTKLLDVCSPGAGTTSYYLHEEDSQDFSSYGPTQRSLYSAMEYTVEAVATPFIRASDTIISQVIVYPIDATGYSKAPTGCPAACVKTNAYNSIKNIGTYINQTYDAAGNPTNMLTYHSWVDVTNYTGTLDGGTFQRIVTPPSGPLPAGQYRLRIDTLGYDGSLPPPNSSCTAPSPLCGGQAHKGYAVRVLDVPGQAAGTCTGCGVGAWDDMAIYSPIQILAGGSFDLPIFKIPPDYAGQTITIDVFDPGDISGGGNVDLKVLDNTNTLVTVTSPKVVNVWDVGTSRSAVGAAVPCTGTGGLTNPPVPCLAQTGLPQSAQIRATTGGAANFNGHWVRFEVPVPSSYAPGANPANWWWSLRYQISTNVTATDTVTFAVGLKGNPAHLLIS